MPRLKDQAEDIAAVLRQIRASISSVSDQSMLTEVTNILEGANDQLAQAERWFVAAARQQAPANPVRTQFVSTPEEVPLDPAAKPSLPSAYRVLDAVLIRAVAGIELLIQSEGYQEDLASDLDEIAQAIHDLMEKIDELREQFEFESGRS